jgi:hypothetical protein
LQGGQGSKEFVNVPASKTSKAAIAKERQSCSKTGVEASNHMPSKLGQAGITNNRSEGKSQVSGAGFGIPKRQAPDASNLDKRHSKALRDIANRENGVYDRTGVKK